MYDIPMHNHRLKFGAPALCNDYSTMHLRSSISLPGSVRPSKAFASFPPNQAWTNIWRSRTKSTSPCGSQQKEFVENIGWPWPWMNNEKNLKLSEATIICVVSLAERILHELLRQVSILSSLLGCPLSLLCYWCYCLLSSRSFEMFPASGQVSTCG